VRRRATRPNTTALERTGERGCRQHVGLAELRDRSEAVISRRPNRRLVASASVGSGTQPLLVGERSARPDGYSAVRLVVDAGLRAMAIRGANATVPLSVPSRPPLSVRAGPSNGRTAAPLRQIQCSSRRLHLGRRRSSTLAPIGLDPHERNVAEGLVGGGRVGKRKRSHRDCPPTARQRPSSRVRCRRGDDRIHAEAQAEAQSLGPLSLGICLRSAGGSALGRQDARLAAKAEGLRSHAGAAPSAQRQSSAPALPDSRGEAAGGWRPCPTLASRPYREPARAPRAPSLRPDRYPGRLHHARPRDCRSRRETVISPARIRPLSRFR